jgi:hypothetical protein
MLMRTTVSLDDDVHAAVTRLQQRDGLGLSEAINTLARRGLSGPTARGTYRFEPELSTTRIDYTKVAETLALLDDEH